MYNIQLGPTRRHLFICFMYTNAEIDLGHLSSLVIKNLKILGTTASQIENQTSNCYLYGGKCLPSLGYKRKCAICCLRFVSSFIIAFRY